MTIYINDFYATIANVPNAFKPVNVVDYNPQITQQDVTNGVIQRYFARQANQPSGQITEISPSVYGQLTSNPFWQVIEVDWRISGPLYDVTGSTTPQVPGVITANKLALGIASQEMPGMQYKILNYVQYYFFSASITGDPPTFMVPTQTPQPTTGSGVTAYVTQSFIPQQISSLQPVTVATMQTPSIPTRSMVLPVTQSTNIATVSVVANAVVPQLGVSVVSSSIRSVTPTAVASIQAPQFILSSSMAGVTVATASHPSVTANTIVVSSSMAAVTVVANAFVPTASALQVSNIPPIIPTAVANTTLATVSVVSSSVSPPVPTVRGSAAISIQTVVVSSSMGQAEAQSAPPVPASMSIQPGILELFNNTPVAITASVFDQYNNLYLNPVVSWSSAFPTYVSVSGSLAASASYGTLQGLIGAQTVPITAFISGTSVSATASITTEAPIVVALLSSPTSSVLYSGSWNLYNVVSQSAAILTVTAFDQFDNVVACGISGSVPQTLVVTPSTLLLSSSNPFTLTTRITDQHGQPFDATAIYQSSNPGVVSVTSTGIVTALLGGQSQSITVSVPNTSLIQIIPVTTTPAVPVSLSVTPNTNTETTVGTQQPEFAVTMDQYGNIYP